MGSERYTTQVSAAVGRPAPRERLLDAAEELFYAGGIAATGVDAVLRRAQTSPPTLYAHFAGKEGLVAAYLQRRHRRWRQAWDEVLAQTEDPSDRLLSVFGALALFRRQTGSTGGCAFLGAAAELPAGRADGPPHAAWRWIDADTTLLRDRLGELAAATGLQDPDGLAAEMLVIYDGVLAGYARHSHDPLATGRRLAHAAVARRGVATP